MLRRTCFTVFNALTRVFASASVYVPVSSKLAVRCAISREIRTLRVVLQLCAVLSDSSESATVQHEGIRATRCQLPRRILGDTSSRENDDYVRGSTRRFYTFPLNQPLTSLRMLRSTIDKGPREASQFDRRDSPVDVQRPAEERERRIPRCA